ncbi:MAG TPA: NAD-binding protein [Pyrinomonadaceae bacterium]|nr:NAD-binding protein [Pyrinomonadaceae bacterium]
MKFLSTQITYFFGQQQIRQNLRALLKYLAFVVGVITLFSVLFHLIMLYVEGRQFSWLTGLYWTLTVMSTLGFGDITFHSDLGRAFSLVVLLSGIILLLIMLPFAFIRYFYAPWLEAQIHFQTPRSAPPDVSGHVIICEYDSIAPGLIRRLRLNQIPYFVIEPDPRVAAELLGDGISVIQGEIDDRLTYERLHVDRALMVFANAEDTINSNIILTVREVAPDVPIAAVATFEDSVDILELSGATQVLPLKQRLGEHLANRINIGRARAHLIGNFKGWQVVEFTVDDTPFSGLMIRETRLRELTGVNIIGVWEHGRLLPADPERFLSNLSVPVGIGTPEQIASLEKLLATNRDGTNTVLIIGGGKVGRAAGRALKQKGITVNMIDRKEELRERIGRIPDLLTIGDAADRDTLMRAGLQEAELVILSTNDDAVNIYLSIYCRRLKPDLRIVSRITHERNIEAIHRAGADFVLSYAPLGAESVISLIQGREPIIMGEGVDLFTVPTPQSLFGKTLAESQIGALTGLIVLAVETGNETITNPAPSTVFPPDSRLLMLGTNEQRQSFGEVFG